MNKNYLPVGSVVSINVNQEATDVVIIGRCLLINTKQFDYMAVKYPSGFTSVEEILYFNRNAISEIINHGYYCQEEEHYNQQLIAAKISYKEG